MIRQRKNIPIHERINMVQHLDVALRVLPLKIALGVFHATFKWRQHGRLFRTLEGAVIIHDATRDCGMGPDGYVGCSIKRIASGMIEVIVRIERRFYRHLSYGTESIHLERSSRRTDKAFNQESAVFSGQEA